MIFHRKAKDRGHLNFGWLDTHHSFSFGSYFDPRFMGFSNLRVINDDIIEGGYGFDTHPHRDMEIITFVKEGAVEHKDTLGSHGIIKPGEIQIMSAGTGIQHSEYNHLKDGKTSLYQIWIEPNRRGVEPRYEQYTYTDRIEKNGLTELVNPKGGEGIASIHADTTISIGTYGSGEKFDFEVDPGRSYWIQVVDGSLEIDGQDVAIGDGVGFKEMSSISGKTNEPTQFLFFNLP